MTQQILGTELPVAISRLYDEIDLLRASRAIAIEALEEIAAYSTRAREALAAIAAAEESGQMFEPGIGTESSGNEP